MRNTGKSVLPVHLSRAKSGKAVTKELSPDDKKAVKKIKHVLCHSYDETCLLLKRRTNRPEGFPQNMLTGIRSLKEHAQESLEMLLPFLVERYCASNNGQRTAERSGISKHPADANPGSSGPDAAGRTRCGPYSRDVVLSFLEEIMKEPVTQFLDRETGASCEQALVIWLLDYFENVRVYEEQQKVEEYFKDEKQGKTGCADGEKKPGICANPASADTDNWSLKSPTYEAFMSLLPAEYPSYDNIPRPVIYAMSFQYSEDKLARVHAFVHNRDGVCRTEFQKMLELIRPQTKERLMTGFVAATLIALDYSLEMYDKHRQEEASAEHAVLCAAARLQASGSLNQFMMNPDGSPYELGTVKSGFGKTVIPSALMRTGKPISQKDLLEKMARLEEIQTNPHWEDFLFGGPECHGMESRCMRRSYSQDVVLEMEKYEKEMAGYAIPEKEGGSEIYQGVGTLDPYDLCFASLLLTEEKAPVLVLNAAAVFTLAYAESLLPWGVDLDAGATMRGSRRPSYERRYREDPVYYTKQENKLRDPGLLSQSGSAGASKESSLDPPLTPDSVERPEESLCGWDPSKGEVSLRTFHFPTENVRLDEDTMEWAKKERDVHMLTFDQLCYITGSILLPRHMGMSEEIMDFVKASGGSEPDAQMIAGAAMMAGMVDPDSLDRYEPQTHPDREAQRSKQDKPVKAEKSARQTVSDSTADGELKQDVEELAGTVAVLKHQLDSMKSAFHEADRENRQLTAMLKEAKLRQQAELTELSELRELFFTRETGGEEDTSSVEETFSFPFRTEHRILVFGGHDSWRKAIRPMLPDVRFYEGSTLSSPAVIQNADVVFFQSNALSHSLFCPLIDEVRRSKTEYHYFSFASAQKCAEQIVRWEKTK